MVDVCYNRYVYNEISGYIGYERVIRNWKIIMRKQKIRLRSSRNRQKKEALLIWWFQCSRC